MIMGDTHLQEGYGNGCITQMYFNQQQPLFLYATSLNGTFGMKDLEGRHSEVYLNTMDKMLATCSYPGLVCCQLYLLTFMCVRLSFKCYDNLGFSRLSANIIVTSSMFQVTQA